MSCENYVMGSKTCYVYIMANAARMIYVGVTGSLERRVFQHKEKKIPGFTEKYNLTKLVYYETFGSPRVAIAREKELKGWLRLKKTKLIESSNPKWKDLAEEWFPERERSGG